MDYRRMRRRKFLSSKDFEDAPRVVTIDHVEQGLIERKGQDPEEAPFVFLREFHEPFILNDTNGETIKTIYGTRDTRKWEGKRIELTVVQTTNPNDGKPCLGICVVPRRPPEEPSPETSAEAERRLMAELAKVRATAQSAPKELPERNVVDAELVDDREVTRATG